MVLFSGLFGILLEINNSHEKRLNRIYGIRAVKDLGREQSERALAHNHIDGLGIAFDRAAAEGALTL